MKSLVVCSLVIFLLPGLLYGGPTPLPVTSSPGGNFSVRSLSGTSCDPGDMITATFSNGTVVKAYANKSGNWFMPVPPGVPTPATATVTCSNGGTSGTITVASGPLLDPPNNHVVANHMVLGSESKLVLGGEIITLTGSFTQIANDVDYDSSSPEYGSLSGFLKASELDITGTSETLGEISIALLDDNPYTVDMLPLWIPQWVDGVGNVASDSIYLDFEISGVINLSSTSIPFTGDITGTSTYSSDGWETFNTRFSLDTDEYGAVTGTLLSSGQAMIVPEPTSFIIWLGIGISIVLYQRKKR
jgi:hypothetical protein